MTDITFGHAVETGLLDAVAAGLMLTEQHGKLMEIDVSGASEVYAVSWNVHSHGEKRSYSLARPVGDEMPFPRPDLVLVLMETVHTDGRLGMSRNYLLFHDGSEYVMRWNWKQKQASGDLSEMRGTVAATQLQDAADLLYQEMLVSEVVSTIEHGRRLYSMLDPVE